MNSDEQGGRFYAGDYGQKAKPKTIGEPPEAEPEYEPDTMGLADGVNCYHQAVFCTFTCDDGEEFDLPLGGFMIGIGRKGSDTRRLLFYVGEEVVEVTVKGSQYAYAHSKLRLGKRATWHPGIGTKSITVRKVEQPKGESGD